jgi:isopenicillin N synthase-like dioxygenase
MFQRLDFGEFRSANVRVRGEFCMKLVASLREFGFVKLVNHGVPVEAIETAFETVSPIMNRAWNVSTNSFQSRNFFRLPLEEKNKSPHPPTANPHRGFTAFGIENVGAVSNHGSKTSLPLLKDMKVSS